MKKHNSTELYIETIYNLTNNDDEIHAVDVAKELSYSKASVSRALKLLVEKELLIIDENNHLFLSRKGKKLAEDVILKHQLIKRFLKENLEITNKTAEEDACIMEHVISDKLFKALKKKYKDK